MKGLFWLILLVILGLATTSAAEVEKSELPAEARAILEKAESYELYSVNPQEPNKESADKTKRFHGHVVLGKTVVKNAEIRKNVRMALLKAIANHPQQGAKCFEPRHGIRASHDGKTVDLLICFECFRIEVWSEGKSSHLLTARSAQPVLDKVLKDAKVPLAKELGK